MDKALYDKGMAMRRKVLGDEYVDRAGGRARLAAGIVPLRFALESVDAFVPGPGGLVAGSRAIGQGRVRLHRQRRRTLAQFHRDGIVGQAGL